MPEIPSDEETSRDWDWFAVDSNGEVGHFTTAGFRLLPASVKADWELAEELISFFESLPNIGEHQVRSEFWAFEKAGSEPGLLAKGDAARESYFRSFVGMARRGLYSYDTELKTQGDYFGVATPISPLKVTDLALAVQAKVQKAASTVRFRETFRIPESLTLKW